MSSQKSFVEWGCEQLLSLGYALKHHQPEMVQNMPWSCVMRFNTLDGYVYLKHVPALLDLEAPITQILYDHFHTAVPEIIAYNSEYHCFLMKDAGKSLRNLWEKKFSPALLVSGIDQLNAIQIAAIDNVNAFLELGVPDWRVDNFKAAYFQLIGKAALLKQDGLSDQELERLHQLAPTFEKLCDRLSSYNILETIVHGDFYANNMLVNPKTNIVTIIDWGEAVIAHPFFSLHTCLWHLTYAYKIKTTDSLYQSIEKQCIAAWLELYPENYLLEAFRVCQQIHGVFAALTYERLYTATKNQPVTVLQQHPGSIAGCLRTFLDAN